MPVSTKTSNEITLKGSAAIIAEFFGYSINNILYQRGIYPPDEFISKKQYGLPIFVTTNNELNTYITNVMSQLQGWIENGKVQQLVLVVTSVQTKETLERWIFNIQKETVSNGEKVEKPQKEIQSEIQAIIRQITSSVTFLPLLEGQCTFDLLVYTDQDIAIPQTWEESDPKHITNQSVRLLQVHKVETAVAYKNYEE
ncbi:DNA-binding HORMA domain-containing protein [Planoprotostelium fungivorum]|uniref:DNA-binding HORMA domain-containing protein n=1 Tax=Planoprotostelium fungivorum TaxID=1890364 RepID=A0A2P6NNM0_9EUKA|nr:DNA-binding HORMA domain-containing protein [Planoprotostelium fungivorum]